MLTLAALSLGVPVPGAPAPLQASDVIDDAVAALPSDRREVATAFTQRWLDALMAAPCGSSGATIAAAAAASSTPATGHAVSITNLEGARVVWSKSSERLHLTFATSVGPLKVDLQQLEGELKMRDISPTSFLPACHRQRLHTVGLVSSAGQPPSSSSPPLHEHLALGDPHRPAPTGEHRVQPFEIPPPSKGQLELADPQFDTDPAPVDPLAWRDAYPRPPPLPPMESSIERLAHRECRGKSGVLWLEVRDRNPYTCQSLVLADKRCNHAFFNHADGPGGDGALAASHSACSRLLCSQSAPSASLSSSSSSSACALPVLSFRLCLCPVRSLHAFHLRPPPCRPLPLSAEYPSPRERLAKLTSAPLPPSLPP